MVSRDKVVKYLNDFLQNPAIKDSSSNGLQVEGAEQITKVGLAVDACLQTYALAAKAGCQMLIVHHGFIWNGLKYVTGSNYKHIKFLINIDLNLFVSHLPLDKHPKIGNNILLAQSLGLKKTRLCFNYESVDIGYRGELAAPKTIQQIAARLAAKTGGKQVILPFGKRKNKTIGIVSGGAGHMMEQAIEMGLDCYVTGEPCHQHHHEAKEAGMNVIFGGHYETETCGVKAVGELIKKKFGLKTVFIDVPTIV
jgi:dinuclear metal center YbgI/SA1388 family protein